MPMQSNSLCIRFILFGAKVNKFSVVYFKERLMADRYLKSGS